MKYIFFILAFQTLFFSTQPIWQAACEQWLSESCPTIMDSLGQCSATASCSAPANQEEGDPTEVPQCCPPFQCCFLSFPGFSTPYSLDITELSEEKTKPQTFIKTLHSNYISDCFHPPEQSVCQV